MTKDIWIPDQSHPDVRIEAPASKTVVRDGRQTAEVLVPDMDKAALVVERADGQKVRTPFSGGARTD